MHFNVQYFKHSHQLSLSSVSCWLLLSRESVIRSTRTHSFIIWISHELENDNNVFHLFPQKYQFSNWILQQSCEDLISYAMILLFFHFLFGLALSTNRICGWNIQIENDYFRNNGTLMTMERYTERERQSHSQQNLNNNNNNNGTIIHDQSR